MNPQVPNELISAYFDGEASPEERAAVESLLDESTATRRELDEIAQLSALLHSFPRESAPTALVANVQRQTDQMPLVVPAAVATVASARSLRREWTAAALGAVVTAAALMLMVNLTDRGGSRSAATPDFGLAMRDNAKSDRVQLRGPMTPAETESIVTTATTLPPIAAADAPHAMKESGVAGGGAPSGADIALKGAPGDGRQLSEELQFRSSATNLMLLDNSVTISNGTILLNNGDFLNGLKEGQVFQFVPQVADPESNVAVVDLEVLDIERGVDQVQVLLSRHSIRPRRSGAMSDRDRQSFEKLKEQSKAGSNEIIAVYTYGPGEKLAKALEDMEQHPDLFVSWSSQPPVQLSNSAEWTDSNSDKSGARDGTVPTDPPAGGQQVAAKRKESVTDDDMDDEAELVLNTVLARGNYSNSGLANVADSNTTGVPQEPVGNAKQNSRTIGGSSGRSRASDPVSRSQSTDSKNSPLAAAPAPSPTTSAKSGAGPKPDAVAKKDIAQQSGYQRLLRVSNDAPVSAEQAPTLNRSQGQNPDRGMNTNRRYAASLGVSQADANMNGRVDANQAVKVLFVLHAAQGQAAQAPAAAPAGKSNR